MNQSRRLISAESVASTNEPLRIHQHQKFHHHQQQQLSSNLTQIIHRTFNPSEALPPLLSHNLVAFSSDDETQQQQLITTATDKHQQQLQQQSFSDWWSEYWSRQPFPSGYTQSSVTLLACLITTIIFLIVVGNLLVCIAIFTEKSLKPTQNWFIASLAVSDMLLGLVVMPFSLARELMGFWIFGPLWCDIHEAVDVLLTTASINTLCLISLDRYWSITQAVSYLKKRTPRRGAFMIAFVWILSAFVSLPPLFGWKKQSPSIIANSTMPINANANTKQAKHTSWEPSGEPAALRARRRDRDELATPLLGQRPSPEPADFLGGPMANASDEDDQLAALMNPIAQVASAPKVQAADQMGTEYPSCQLSDDVGYVLYSALGSFYIPCAVMVFTYIKIFLAARSRARRAINKQSRGNNANKRLAARRSQPSQAGQVNAIKEPMAEPLTCCGSLAMSAGAQNNESGAQPVDLVPLMKGKLVIVERRKSLAAPNQLGAGQVKCAEEPSEAVGEVGANTRPTYACSELARAEQVRPASAAKGAAQQRADRLIGLGLDERAASSCGELSDEGSSCIVTTSGAHQASPSALNSSASLDHENSSMITVMNSSMAETPVTRFTFKDPYGALNGSSEGDKAAQKEDKAAALLRAISEAAAFANHFHDQDDREPASSSSGGARDDDELPDIVVQRRATSDSLPLEQVQGTNETCFMTIEEDSDMFEAQAGRTITMIAATASQRQASSLARTQGSMMTMMPPGSVQTPAQVNQQVGVCSNALCKRQQQQQQQQQAANTRSASSYCGSSLTINYDDIDDCQEELLTDECNGYSVSCALDHYSASCIHCHECLLEHDQQVASNRHLSGACDSPASRQCKHGELPSEIEIQSMIGDDNVSRLTEFRSQDDLSSIVGHDVLDATESVKRKSQCNRPQSSLDQADRKRSIIGFQLARLGGSTTAPLMAQTGGLLALASSQQQQASGATSGARNLKALRQNFFLKLNQLTAKTANKCELKNKRSNPSSAQSSGTDHEASVDCATTSNVHSNEYPQEITGGELDDFEQHTSADSQNQAKYSAETETGQRHSIGANKLLADHQHGGANSQLSSKTQSMDANKSPDDRTTLLRGSQSGLINRRLLGTNSTIVASTTSKWCEQEKARNKRQAGQLNHSLTVMSSSAGGSSTNPGSATNRAYLASDNERHKRKLAKARERRATLILGLIMTTFICSWMPFFTFYVLRAFCVSCRGYVSPRIEAFIFWAGYCNSAINPIIYTIFNRDFRKAFRKILFKCL